MIPAPAPESSPPRELGLAGAALPSGAVRPRLLLIAVTTAGLLAFVLLPWVQRALGLFDFDHWFLDSYAVLAASDAVRAGIDPTLANPFDVFGRPHSYSDWWYGLGRIGLDLSDNFLVGATWVGMFLAVVWLTLRPRDTRETWRYAFLVLSPPVLLAIVRGNNDLVVFALLGFAAVALRAPSTARCAAALGLIAVAEGLKFYPVVAGSVFLLLRPVRRMLIMTSASAVVLGVVLANVWPALGRGVFTLPQALYTFGGPVLFRDLGWMGRGPMLAGFTIIMAAGVWLASSGRTTGLCDAKRSFERRVLFALGAVTLLACFLAGASYAYRWIFGLWLAPWLWDEARDPQRSEPRRRIARLAGTLLLGLMWTDGVFCFVVNVMMGPMAEVPGDRWQLIWRLVTQPLVWVLMALLAGWLLDATLARWRELRGAGTPGENSPSS